MAARSVYIHIPFCAHHCGYCNFSVAAGRDDLIDAYLVALEREIASLSAPWEVDTIYLGGGTPNHLAPGQLNRLLDSLRTWFRLSPAGEFSMEANPERFDQQRAEIAAAHGVNRISLGAQSFNAEKLALLERSHSAAEIVSSVQLAKERAMQVSLDLIFGVQGESLANWRNDLQRGMELEPDHISTYGLTYEKGTAFWSRRLKGDLQSIDEDLDQQLYLAAVDDLEQGGWAHYEVSNHARPGRECRHNLAYWSGEDFLAFGSGAARLIHGRREVNHRSMTTYIKRVMSGQSPVAEAEELDAEDRAREFFVFSLRKIAGLRRAEFLARTGFQVEAILAKPLQKHLALGLLVDNGETIRLTRRGLLVSDSIWPDFLRR